MTRIQLFFITIFLLFSAYLVAQPSDDIATTAEQMPYFEGCQNLENGTEDKRNCSNEKLIAFISDNVTYPEEALQSGVEGTVLVQFVVNTRGKIENPTILRDIGGACGKEAIRMVRLMPDWEPALDQGQPVAVRLNLPVTFSLNDANYQLASKYQIQWGNLSGKRTSREELKSHLLKKLFVRDEYGDEVSISSLTFAYHKNRYYTEQTSTGKITSKMARLIKKVKKGGTFTIIATVLREGSIVEVERDFEVAG